MTRRPLLALSLVVLLAAAATAALLLTRDRSAAPAVLADMDRADGLTLVVVRAPGGPFAAVIGSTGAEDGVLALPREIAVTIPGQGEARLGEALDLPPRQAATTAANLLGVWVDHYAVIDRNGLARVVDRSGGIRIGDEVLPGDAVLRLLDDAGDGATATMLLLLSGLLRDDVVWEASDLAETDSASTALETFVAASGAPVGSLPVVEASGVYRAEADDVRMAVLDAFGGPDREVVDVIVLNGSGVPGVGERVAERIVPRGFRVVISENASTFDHPETLVVVGSADDVVLAERVRDLLGTGSVNVSVSSGIAPVTIVVGKDFGV